MIKEHKKSSAFKDEMTEAGIFSYEVGSADCKEKVMEIFPHLDLQKVIICGDDEEGGSDQIAEALGPATSPEATVWAEEDIQDEGCTESGPEVGIDVDED